MLRQRQHRPTRPAPLHGVPLSVCVVAAAAALAALMLVAVGVGSVSVPLADTWRIVVYHVTGWGSAGDFVFDQIVWDIRVPRVLLAALCGAGLSVAGVVLQALVGNPLAEPYVLGLVPGASVGAVLVITAGAGIVGGISVSVAAFAGAMAAGVLVFALGQRYGRLAPTRLVLSGIAVGYVCIALTSYLQLKASPSDLRRVMFWLLGSVAGANGTNWARSPPSCSPRSACCCSTGGGSTPWSPATRRPPRWASTCAGCGSGCSRWPRC